MGCGVWGVGCETAVGVLEDSLLLLRGGAGRVGCWCVVG